MLELLPISVCFSFSQTILLRSVDTRALMNNSFFKKKLAQHVFEIFSAFITPQYLNIFLKLCLYQGVKIFENYFYFRFFLHQINPTSSRVIINKGHKPFFSRIHRYFTWPPDITMNHSKWCSWFVGLDGKRCMMMFSKLTNFTLQRRWTFIPK
jgi:hypothetical protein